MTPNAYIIAALPAKAGFVSANVLVPIPDPSRKLDVTITPERDRYMPGDTAVYTIRTTNGPDHKPVPAEVAVSVVDESIYAL